MANTKSAKKNIRSAKRKKAHNLVWEKQIKGLIKTLKVATTSKTGDIEQLTVKLTSLQKALDKASKEKVIHKNKANRLKSMYARKISALFSAKAGKVASKSTKSAK